MKKIFSAVLVLAVLAILAGCGTSAKVVKIEGLEENENTPKLIEVERTGLFGHDATGFMLLKKKSVVSSAPTTTTSTVRKCSEEKIRELYRRLNENAIALSKCKYFCLNNLGLRLERERILAELGECTCDIKFFQEAIKNLEIAARNYKNGKDTKNSKGEMLMTQVYKDWETLKRRDLASCSVEVKSVVELPSTQQVAQDEITPLYFGGNSSVGNFAVPALIGAGGYVAGQAVRRPNETNINASGGSGSGGAGGTGGSGGSASSSSSSSSAASASSSSAAAAAAEGN